MDKWMTGQHCSTCKEEIECLDMIETCVGYCYPKGHYHDKNCVNAKFKCLCGDISFEPQIKCPAEGCTWEGPKQCQCSGAKVHVDDMPNNLGQFFMDLWKREL